MKFFRRRNYRRVWLFLQILFLGSVVAMAMITHPPFQQVADDSTSLFRFLSRQQGSQVLGVTNQDAEPCPDERPVIGWIDYSGQKLVVNSLPPDASPSACFQNQTEAVNQGYYKND